MAPSLGTTGYLSGGAEEAVVFLSGSGLAVCWSVTLVDGLRRMLRLRVVAR